MRGGQSAGACKSLAAGSEFLWSLHPRSLWKRTPPPSARTSASALASIFMGDPYLQLTALLRSVMATPSGEDARTIGPTYATEDQGLHDAALGNTEYLKEDFGSGMSPM